MPRGINLYYSPREGQVKKMWCFLSKNAAFSCITVWESVFWIFWLHICVSHFWLRACLLESGYKAVEKETNKQKNHKNLYPEDFQTWRSHAVHPNKLRTTQRSLCIFLACTGFDTSSVFQYLTVERINGIQRTEWEFTPSARGGRPCKML
jgi:hypothetical protein